MSEQNAPQRLPSAQDRKQIQRINQRPTAGAPVKASSACKACKLRRSKCSAESPCKACLRANTQCVYDESSDRRRKIAERRTADRLLQARELFSSLLETLRFGQRDQVDHVLRIVRFDTPLKDIVATILQTRREIGLVDPSRALSLENLDELSPDMFTSSSDSRTRPYHRPLSLHELCWSSPFQMHTRHWTTVADEKVTEHLLSVYLTWYQPFIHILDEDAFLHDMSSGTSEFCSSVLVNAICALVSSWLGLDTYLDHAFWNECHVCLENERGRPALPTVQALFLMFLREGGQGRDAISLHYRYLASDMYLRLKLDSRAPSPEIYASDPVIAKWWNALSVAMWGLYSLETILGFHYGYVPQIPKPTVEKYFAETDDPPETLWIPYPLSGDGIPYKSRETLLALCDLSELLSRVLHHNKSESIIDGSPEDVERRVEMYQELLGLKARNPVISDDLTDSAAHTYTMIYYYNVIAISALRPLQLLPDVTLPERFGTPKDLCYAHVNQLISASGQYRARYSSKYSCGLIAAAPYVAAFTLLPHLDNSSRAVEPFTMACQYMRECMPRLDVLRYSLRALEALALLHKVQIPPNALQYFQGLDIDDASLENIPCTLVTAELPPNAQLNPLPGSSSNERVIKAKMKIEAESMRDLLAWWSKT